MNALTTFLFPTPKPSGFFVTSDTKIKAASTPANLPAGSQIMQKNGERCCSVCFRSGVRCHPDDLSFFPTTHTHTHIHAVSGEFCMLKIMLIFMTHPRRIPLKTNLYNGRRCLRRTFRKVILPATGVSDETRRNTKNDKIWHPAHN